MDRKWKLHKRSSAAMVIQLQKEVQLHLSHMAAFQTFGKSNSTELTNLDSKAVVGKRFMFDRIS